MTTLITSGALLSQLPPCSQQPLIVSWGVLTRAALFLCAGTRGVGYALPIDLECSFWFILAKVPPGGGRVTLGASMLLVQALLGALILGVGTLPPVSLGVSPFSLAWGWGPVHVPRAGGSAWSTCGKLVGLCSWRLFPWASHFQCL